MQGEDAPVRKYEEYACVLDYNVMDRSTTIKGREGIIVIAIGEDWLTLLEILGIPNTDFEIGEKIFIGKEGRTKVLSVLGKMEYKKISDTAKHELPAIVENIVTTNEKRFVDYLNNARPLTPRVHAFELIPGIGKAYMKVMLEERDRQKFESYADLQERVGLKNPIKHITERILDEITGDQRMNIFVKR